MSVLSWISPRLKRLEEEKKNLKVELTQSLMEFGQRSTEVRQIADDVMKVMHRKAGNEKD